MKQQVDIGEIARVALTAGLGLAWFYVLINVVLVYGLGDPGSKFEIWRFVVAALATALWWFVSPRVRGQR